MCEEGGRIDTSNFCAWAHKFVSSIYDLTAVGRLVILTYDGYGAHLSLKVYYIFLSSRVMVYVLLSHIGHKTQSIDVVVFSIF